MSLKDDLNKIGDNLTAALEELQSEFTGFEAEQEAERTKFFEAQEKALQEKRDELTKRDAEARDKAQADTEATIEAADKLLAEAHEKDQAALNEKLAAAGGDKGNNGRNTRTVAVE